MGTGDPPGSTPPEPELPSGAAGGAPSATTPSAQEADSLSNETATPSKTLNLVGEPVSQNPAVVQEELYNADQSRDATRQTVTLWLIGLLCAIVGLTFVALFARGAATGFTDKEFFHELKQILDVLVGPVITLLASAIGFYFGYKQGELGQRNKNGGSST